jgi:hypothetical protein
MVTFRPPNENAAPVATSAAPWTGSQPTSGIPVKVRDR